MVPTTRSIRGSLVRYRDPRADTSIRPPSSFIPIQENLTERTSCLWCMSMIRFVLVLLVFSLVSDAGAQDWQLVWSDEFDTPGAPDPERWNYDIGGHGWGNQELQYYTDREVNARVEGGVLVIEAHRETFSGSDYTSARLVTRDRAAWRYGRIEARIKLPFGQGIWPAFWMLPEDSPYGGWPAGGEIDIMEYLGHDTDRVYGTLHSGGGALGHRFTGTHYDLVEGTFEENFHVFALEWEPRVMRWYVDGELYLTQVSWSSAGGPYPAPFDTPFHILINLAVGGQWPGYPDETTTFPQRMEVDYVRVYEDAAAYPHVALDGPADSARVDAGATVSLSATASDGGAVESVTFLQGEGVLGIVTNAPYALDVDDVLDGCYVLLARARDDSGYVSESEPATLTVGAGCPAGSTSPYLMAPASLPGTIEAEYYDLGGSSVAYLDFSGQNEGSGIRQDEGVDIRPSRDDGGGFDVTNILAREWLSYTVDAAQSGTYRVLARVASGTGGTLRLSIDGEDMFGDVALSPTGGDATYGNAVLGFVELEAGRHNVRLDMRSAGFSLNRLTFAYLTGTAVEEDVGPRDLKIHLAPNPAAAATVISFPLPQPDNVVVELFDMLGRRVRVLTSGASPAGELTVHFDAAELAPGVYVCAVTTSGGLHTELFSVVR